MPRAPVERNDIQSAVESLGLAGRPVCLHTSLRSFGWIDGGANTVVDGFLDAGCTVMVPAFTSGFNVAPPLDRRYPRNGLDYEHADWPGEAREDIFSPNSTVIDEDMGAIPAAIVRMKDRVRGNHPSDSFVAVGPLAEELIRRQTAFAVYAPFAALVERGGSVVLIGVDLTRMTLLHLAEKRAGRTLFRRWARDAFGGTIECRLGSCSEGFERLRPFLKPIERTRTVGQSPWRIYPAAQVLELGSAAIRNNPDITHCSNPDCIRCRDAVLGGPIVGGGR